MPSRALHRVARTESGHKLHHEVELWKDDAAVTKTSAQCVVHDLDGMAEFRNHLPPALTSWRCAVLQKVASPRLFDPQPRFGNHFRNQWCPVSGQSSAASMVYAGVDATPTFRPRPSPVQQEDRRSEAAKELSKAQGPKGYQGRNKLLCEAPHGRFSHIGMTALDKSLSCMFCCLGRCGGRQQA